LDIKQSKSFSGKYKYELRPTPFSDKVKPIVVKESDLRMPKASLNLTPLASKVNCELFSSLGGCPNVDVLTLCNEPQWLENTSSALNDTLALSLYWHVQGYHGCSYIQHD
jgi:hypothetical protein